MGMPWSPMGALHRINEDQYEVRDGETRVAIIRRVEIGHPAEWYWRSVTWDDDPAARSLLGYFPTLKFATYVTWRLWDQHGRVPVEEQYV